MIQILDKSAFRQKKAKEVIPATEKAKIKTPFYLSDSNEADWIKDKIKANKEYLLKCQSKTLYQKVEKDTLYLENQILPIIQLKTNLYYAEAVKLFITSLDKAVENGCNSLIMYLPINEQYTDKPKAGVSNCKSKLKHGTPGACEIKADLYLYNRDGNSAPFEIIDLDV